MNILDLLLLIYNTHNLEIISWRIRYRPIYDYIDILR